MSLIVYAYRRDPETGKMLDLEVAPVLPCNELAGFESWRHEVWGASVVRDLGLKLIPSLANEDLYAEGSDLDQLDTELERLIENLSTVAATTNIDAGSLRFRIDNMREAVRLARQAGNGTGGVYIG